MELKQNHLIMQSFYWEDPAETLADRVAPAPPEVIDYLVTDNLMWGIDQRPVPATWDDAFEMDMRRALESMPPRVVELISDRMMGLFLVEELGGTAFTERIRDPSMSGKGFIVLDANAIDKTANEWSSWKDNSPFEAGPHRLESIIAKGQEDTRAAAMQYILLHEFGHVISIDSDIHPNWTLDDGRWPPSPGEYPYFDLTWEVDGSGLMVSKYQLRYPVLLNIPFYFSTPKKPNDQMIPLFDALEKSGFSTPYSVISFGDDFADSFANFVHTKILDKPYQIEIYREDTLIKKYIDCWQQKRCAQKRRFLEDLLQVN
jgi:hypothetical protein